MDEHTVADLLCQAQESVLMQCAVADVGGAVALGLLGSLLEKTLRVGAHGLARHALAAGEPEMAAEVIAGAAALLDARERLRGIEAAAEAALDVVVILRFALVRAKLGAQRVGRAHHAVLAGDRGRGPMPPGVLFAVYDSKTGNPDYIPPEYNDVPGLLD